MSRSKTENVAEMLRKHGIRVAVYHAGLSATARDEAQNNFINDRVQVVCADHCLWYGHRQIKCSLGHPLQPPQKY